MVLPRAGNWPDGVRVGRINFEAPKYLQTSVRIRILESVSLGRAEDLDLCKSTVSADRQCLRIDSVCGSTEGSGFGTHCVRGTNP